MRSFTHSFELLLATLDVLYSGDLVSFRRPRLSLVAFGDITRWCLLDDRSIHTDRKLRTTAGHSSLYRPADRTGTIRLSQDDDRVCQSAVRIAIRLWGQQDWRDIAGLHSPTDLLRMQNRKKDRKKRKNAPEAILRALGEFSECSTPPPPPAVVKRSFMDGPFETFVTNETLF